MADKVNVDQSLFLDPRVENEDGSFGAWKPGYRDPDTHFIVFTDDPVEAAEDESQPAAETETVEVEAEVVPQVTEDADSDENAS